MAEWWTYRLDDFVMFSPRAWFALVARHNQAGWPLQLVTGSLGLAVVLALLRRRPQALRLGLVLTGAALVWVAASFHAGPHADINLAAPAFAVAFALQGLGMVVLALARPGLAAAPGGRLRAAGLAALLLALAGYPAALWLAGRPLVQIEWFGLGPDPTMLAALALALLVGKAQGLRRPRRVGALLLLLPLAWCGVSVAMAWVLATGIR